VVADRSCTGVSPPGARDCTGRAGEAGAGLPRTRHRTCGTRGPGGGDRRVLLVPGWSGTAARWPPKSRAELVRARYRAGSFSICRKPRRVPKEGPPTNPKTSISRTLEGALGPSSFAPIHASSAPTPAFAGAPPPLIALGEGKIAATRAVLLAPAPLPPGPSPGHFAPDDRPPQGRGLPGMVAPTEEIVGRKADSPRCGEGGAETPAHRWDDHPRTPLRPRCPLPTTASALRCGVAGVEFRPTRTGRRTPADPEGWETGWRGVRFVIGRDQRRRSRERLEMRRAKGDGRRRRDGGSAPHTECEAGRARAGVGGGVDPAPVFSAPKRRPFSDRPFAPAAKAACFPTQRLHADTVVLQRERYSPFPSSDSLSW